MRRRSSSTTPRGGIPRASCAGARWGRATRTCVRFPTRTSRPQPCSRALRARAGDGSQGLQLGEAPPRWSGALQLAGKGRDEHGEPVELRFHVDAQGLAALARVTPSEDAAPPSWSAGEPALAAHALAPQRREALIAAATGLLRERGIEVESLAVRREPSLEFEVAQGALTCECSLARDGRLEAQVVDGAPDWRSRWLRLHVQHGDPGYASARRIWFLIVDLVGAAMLLWAASGVVMGWSLRPTRRTGAAAVGLGFAAMAVLAFAVWAETGA